MTRAPLDNSNTPVRTDPLSPSASISPAAQAHLAELSERLPVLRPIAADIAAAFALLDATFDAGRQVLVCGNGGSAADAEHFAGELLKGFESKRPLARGYGLPDGLDAKLQRGLPVIPLTGFVSLRTAVANDCDGRLEFAQLVEALGRPGDVLVGLSTSGRSANICLAAQVAKGKAMRVLSLTGSGGSSGAGGGGPLATLADVAVRVPAERTRLVQELHLPIYHTLCLMLESARFGEGGR